MILDLFSGIEGWGEGLRALGHETIGFEFDADAARTARAAGHHVIRVDVTTFPTAQFRDVWGIVGSPPCPTFSRAGDREGIQHLPALVAHVRRCATAWAEWVPETEVAPDRRTGLVLEPLRFVHDLRPEWVALEQVPDVLPVWEAYAATLRAWGYSTWAGVLCAADYGVPQTRNRAILMASRTRTVAPPEPTHCKGGAETLFGQLAPWVSMATALGWGATARPYPTVVGSHLEATFLASNASRDIVRNEREAGRWKVGFPRRADTPSNNAGDDVVTIDGTEYRARDLRDADEPSFVVTEKARSWTVHTGTNSATRGPGQRTGDWREESEEYTRSVDEPAPTVDVKAGGAWRIEPDEAPGAREIPREDSGELGHTTGGEGEGPRGIPRDSRAEPMLDTGMDWKPGGTREDAQQRPLSEPAPSMTAKSGGQWRLTPGSQDKATVRRLDEPAPTVAFGHDSASWGFTEDEPYQDTENDWTHDRPATTVACDSRVWPPGHKVNEGDRERLGRAEADGRYGDRAGTNAIKLQPEDALALQGFPRDYPVTGTRTAKFRQIGNAWPPPCAEAVCRVLTDG